MNFLGPLPTPSNTQDDLQSPPPPPPGQLPPTRLSRTPSPSPPEVQRHPDFYQHGMTDPIILRVHKTLYRLSRHTLASQFGLFRDMFELPVGDNNRNEGATDEFPVFVPSISEEGFNFILNVAIGRYNDRPPLKHLITGLEYSLLWTIPTVRGYCIDHIDCISRREYIHPAILLSLARRHGIPQWIYPAVQKLQHTPLSTITKQPDNIMSTINLDTYSGIARLRESLFLA